MSRRKLAGRVVVITGASAGIGHDLAVSLCGKGATVVGAARDLQRLKALAKELDSFEPVRCDVAVDADRADLVEKTLKKHGRIDALVNNAGLGWEGMVEDMPLEKIEYLYAVNVIGLIDLSRRVLPGMLERGAGDIVNISSGAGFVSLPPFTVYSSTKHAVNGFTDGLRREVMFRGLNVHLVNPGPIKTEWLPRSQGYEPLPGGAEVRAGGFRPAYVVKAVERCLRRPYPRIVSVPRFLGVSRLPQLFGIRTLVDLGAAAKYGRAKKPKG